MKSEVEKMNAEAFQLRAEGKNEQAKEKFLGLYRLNKDTLPNYAIQMSLRHV